jgi:hypothetical protein
MSLFADSVAKVLKGTAVNFLPLQRSIAHRSRVERGLAELPERWIRNNLGSFPKIDSSAWLREATMVHHPIRKRR